MRRLLLTMGLVSLSAVAFAQSPPFADGPDTKPGGPKPANRTWTVNQDGFSYTFSFEPGIPDANQVTEITLFVNEVPKTPDPKFGNRVPLTNARITVEAVNPAGESLGRFLAHALPLAAGRYGMHLTPAQDGIYTLTLKGKTAAGKTLAAEVKLPVNVWPLPAELEGSGAAEAGGATVRRPLIKK